MKLQVPYNQQYRLSSGRGSKGSIAVLFMVRILFPKQMQACYLLNQIDFPAIHTLSLESVGRWQNLETQG
jgi:hypothetical protein